MDKTRKGLAQALTQAHRDGSALDANDWQDSVVRPEDAYWVQDAVAAAMGWWQAGQTAAYWKAGGGARSAVLTHAGLPPSGVRGNGADFSDLPWRAAPGIEAEVALRLARDVTPGMASELTQDAVDGLIDAMTVSVEIVDSRLAQGNHAPALLRLADLQSHGALALGTWIAYARRDWQAQCCEVRIDAGAPQRYTGTHALADPAWVLPQWLRHLTRDGATVPAGTVVTTGTWNGVATAHAGAKISVTFAELGEVRLSV